ncbi:NADH-quinone oxidoreductase subunit NuoH [bacterium]|nr:NADH-quinone oxidoreductase subunit NuoH [bacterium]
MNYLLSIFIDFFANFGIPKEVVYIIFPIIPFCIVAAALILVVLVLVLVERKILALFTQRKGPNRVGFCGILQTVADAVKLLCKENIEPNVTDRILFSLAPIIAFVPVMVCWGIIPFSSEFDFISISVSSLLFAVIAVIPVIGVILAGYSSNNKYSLIGSVRSAVQVISYELPIMFVILSVSILASSLNIKDIILSQTSMYQVCGWYIFPCFLGFVILFVSSLAELNRCPFDLPEAESELVAGYNTEYSGMRFALFFLGEYAMLFVSSAFITALFFGGFLSPFGFYISEKIFNNNVLAQIGIYFEQAFWFFIKSFLIVFLIMWVRAVLPRLKSSDLLKFSWRILLPLSILNFIYICLFKYIVMIGGLK